MRFASPLNQNQLFTLVTGRAYPAILGTLGYRAATEFNGMTIPHLLVVALFLVHYCFDFLWTATTDVQEGYSEWQSFFDFFVIAALLGADLALLKQHPIYVAVLSGMVACKIFNSLWKITGKKPHRSSAVTSHGIFAVAYGLGCATALFKPGVAHAWLTVVLAADVVAFMLWPTLSERGLVT